MDVQLMSTKDVKPYEKNPRHNDEAVEAVANSIREFGFKQPIVVDKDNVIIAGHTRWKAAKKLKLKEVPVIVASDLSEDQVRAYRIADNSTGELATWDYDKLVEELQGITFDMGQFGLDTEQYLETTEMPEITEDTPPTIPDEPTTARGQIIRLGDHILMCGDSTNAEDVSQLMKAAEIEEGSVDMVMTDPPYNVAIEGETEEHLTIENDDMDDGQFKEF